MIAALLVAAWVLPGWVAITIGTPLRWKRQDPVGYWLIRAFSGTTAGPIMLLLWALNVNGMRDAEWRPVRTNKATGQNGGNQ